MGDFNIYKADNEWDEAFKSFTPFVDLESLYSFIDSQFDLYKNQINPPKDCVSVLLDVLLCQRLKLLF